jgi:hypothetical protein
MVCLASFATRGDGPGLSLTEPIPGLSGIEKLGDLKMALSAHIGRGQILWTSEPKALRDEGTIFRLLKDANMLKNGTSGESFPLVVGPTNGIPQGKDRPLCLQIQHRST